MKRISYLQNYAPHNIAFIIKYFSYEIRIYQLGMQVSKDVRNQSIIPDKVSNKKSLFFRAKTL